jgi:hypothetical protein
MNQGLTFREHLSFSNAPRQLNFWLLLDLFSAKLFRFCLLLIFGRPNVGFRRGVYSAIAKAKNLTDEERWRKKDVLEKLNLGMAQAKFGKTQVSD